MAFCVSRSVSCSPPTTVTLIPHRTRATRRQDVHAEAICSGLVDNSSVAYLNLDRNGITGRGADALGKLLVRNKTILEVKPIT